MMTKNNWVSQFFETIDAKNWGKLKTLLDTNVIYERPGYETMKGRNSVMEFYTEKRAIKVGSHIIQDVYIHDNKIICNGSFSGMSNDNTKLQVEFCDIYLCNYPSLIYRKTYFFIPW